ncbi:MAG TPA: exodeoxyribonuclease V subunit gamma, partial [Tepidisphaeraceae bacterium]|nr:exodeoxyribonuclease V subunit gamma [Tepidisphaeraceae bacterium]
MTVPIDADALAQAETATAALFARPLRSYRALHRRLAEAKVKVLEPTVLGAPRRFRNERLTWIERHWEQLRADPRPAEGVELIEAATRRDEVAGAARWIRARLAEGMRLRDIAVLMRSNRDYADLVDAVFREHELPAFIDRRRTARHHPLIQLLRGLLRVVTAYWPIDAMLSIARSALTPLTLDQADLLENFILDHRLTPSAWRDPQQWQFEARRSMAAGDPDVDPDTEPARELVDAETLRDALVTPIAPLFDALATSQEQPVRSMVEALLACFERFGVRRRLGALVLSARPASPELADEHEAVWKQLIELFDQLVELLGDQSMPPSRLIDLIEYGLEQFDLALAPPTVDQILVGDADRSRLPPIKACVVLGMNEGQFPIAPTENAILGDIERERLRQAGAPLDPDTLVALGDEDYLGYVAMTRSSERLLLTRATMSEGGRPTAPGAYWRRVRALLPSLEVVAAPPSPGTPAEAVRCVLDWLSSDLLDPDATSAGWYELLRTAPPAPLQRHRDLAWRWIDRARPHRLPKSIALQL